MPSSLLFGVSHEGHVHGLSTNGSKWRELVYLGLEFKTLSSVPHMLWAIGGDRQVYVYVHGLDIPIRIKEESYENQRWLPVEGFSNRLLPMDRFQFSSMDGLTDRTQSKIRLPSMAWQWESDWHLELTLDGQPLNHDGWTYAVDFPAKYYPQKQWTSCVRRRKWVRYRRYSALNSWCAIAPLHKDATQEPFIDVAVGGQCLAGSDPGSLLVWAVTAHGRVMFRWGVGALSPEGTRWEAVTIPPGCEIKQICVGATGLVWAVLWNGRALVRVGVTRHNPTGEYWLEVGAPADNQRLSQVAVGTNSVWAVTNNHKVWFRRGIRGSLAGEGEECARGAGWVEMVGRMALVSVASNDQVWAIGAEDRLLYFRTGVSNSELTGKTWRLMAAPSQLSRASSSASLWSAVTAPNPRSISTSARPPSCSTIGRESSSASEAMSEGSEETSRSVPTANQQPTLREPEAAHSAPYQSLQQLSLNVESPSPEGSQGDQISLSSVTVANDDMISHPDGPCVKTNPTVWSPVKSVGGVLGTEAQPETEVSVFTSEDNLEGMDTLETDTLWGSGNTDMLWSCVAAGAVIVDPQALPNWFVENQQSFVPSELAQPWRMKILQELKRKTADATMGFADYEKPVEKSSWVKSGRARVILKDSAGHPEECALELEWVGNESGTLSVLSPDRTHTKLQLSVSEITCIACCSEPGIPCIAVHTSRLRPGKGPLKLQFTAETDMEDWMANLTLVCCQVNGARGTPSAGSLWATTTRGDVFVFDPATLEAHQLRGESYVQEMLVAGRSTPYETHLHNSFPPGSQITLLASAHQDTERFHVNLVCRSQSLVPSSRRANMDQSIAFHFNPRFPDNVIVRNSKRNGAWENEEREGGLPITRGEVFSICIICQDDALKVLINNTQFTFFEHRLKPHTITHIEVDGDLLLHKLIYESKMVIVSPADMYWRQMGGHLRRVETCAGGVTWGIGYDCTPWVYTGGWGGSFLKGLETSSSGINAMTDTHAYYVYENQRWNPLTGYTAHMLPTDRHMWSDASGRHKRLKETTKLLSMHWQWVSDWSIDFHVPGGVDQEGWQYAIDFPATYHSRKGFTDYVRRRRWVRRAQLSTSGPWEELSSTKLLHVSLQLEKGAGEDGPVRAWAVTTDGEVIFRKGVSKSCPIGIFWEHVPCDQRLVCISCGVDDQVWAIGRNGSAFWRFGITSTNPLGEVWETVEPPPGVTLKLVSVGCWGIWVLDNNGQLSVRREVTSVFPEGTHWQTLPPFSLDNIDVVTVSEVEGTAILSPTSTAPTPTGWRHVSAGPEGEVWAISSSGVVCRRHGVTKENPAGISWSHGVVGGWQCITARGWTNNQSSN